MKKTVCFEAFLLCMVGIPVGILAGICGIGITLSAFQEELEYLLGNEKNVSIHLSVSPKSVIAAAVIGTLTVLVSAYLPMRRALKVSAIEAIRQKEDIRLTKKKLKIPGWVNRFFGLYGTIAWKNFKRNKKQYRTTIVSLAMSILLFVSAGSFSEYLFGSYLGAVEMTPYDIEVSFHGDSYDEVSDTIRRLCDVEGAELLYQTVYFYVTLEPEEEGWTVQGREFYQDSTNLQAALVFLPDDIFAELLDYYHLEAEKYRNDKALQAVVFPNVSYWENGELMKGEVLSDTCQSLKGSRKGEDGEILFTEFDIGDVVDNSALEQTEIPFLERCLEIVGDYFIKIIYPMSMAQSFFSGTDAGKGDFGYDIRGELFFQAPNHAEICDAMRTAAGEGRSSVYDAVADEEQTRALYLMINVFCFGFILLISLISAANIFNTISTNMNIRRREFAMLKSLGMTQREYHRMLNFECIIYGGKGLILGFLLSFSATVLMYYAGNGKSMEGFFLPWRYFVISFFCVFAVVYATMLYGRNRAKKENLMEELKGEA